MHLERTRKTNCFESRSACQGPVVSAQVLLFAFCAFLVTSIAVSAQQPAPELLTYDELVQLYEQQTPPDALQKKLSALLTTPFVSNAASARGVKPLLPSSAKLGKFVRVVEWNIERGLEYDAIRKAFTNPAALAFRLRALPQRLKESSQTTYRI